MNEPGYDATSASAGDINIGYNERMAGAIGGPLLALYGLTRGTPSGLVLAAGGGYLLYRSLTGHCPVYQAARRDHCAQRQRAAARREERDDQPPGRGSVSFLA